MNTQKLFHGIGLMSGSSLDGLDICYAAFTIGDPENWKDINYKILHATCISYDNTMKQRLQAAAEGTALEVSQLHTELGNYFGTLTNDFLNSNNLSAIDFICSHGQTIFHQPEVGFTTQIGCGAQIAAKTRCRVVCDLRTTDVAYGGQGAPIVPIAEKFLFEGYNVFLNLGGIANLSIHDGNNIVGFDICAANTMLNHLAREKNAEYDAGGAWARSGQIIPELLEKMNAIPFCSSDGPKSLGTEHVMKHWITLCDSFTNSTEDKLATAVEHIAIQVAMSLKGFESLSATERMMISGGGALNTFLTERIAAHSKISVNIPDVLTIQYKEALAMAFIGLLRIQERANCLSTVTGAQKNVIGGAIYLP
jgi:anhydro-N-acetylmuramic acid kinase